MKVFLDTNVLASAVATRGLCADVFREVLAVHELILSVQVLAELKQVLAIKFHVPQVLIDDFIQLLQQEMVYAKSVRLPGLKLTDKDDIPIVSAAVHAGAEVFVTGEREILNLKKIQDLLILSPRQFWEMLAAPEKFY